MAWQEVCFVLFLSGWSRFVLVRFRLWSTRFGRFRFGCRFEDLVFGLLPVRCGLVRGFGSVPELFWMLQA